MRAMVPLDRVVMIGNHGMEWLEDGRRRDAPEAAPFRERLAAVASQLAERVGDDIITQPKGLSISLHYRLAPDPAAARARLVKILTPLLAEHGLRLQQGRLVIDLRPDCPVDKGSALEQLVEGADLTHVVVFGDDETDAAAFQRLGELRRKGRIEGLSIAVVSDEADDALVEAADYRVSGPDEVIGLLGGLLATARSSASFS